VNTSQNTPHPFNLLTSDFRSPDRGNISNALTDRFFADLGISQDQFNVGQQMLSLGIVLFEIPSNMILYRIGPGRWLTLQLFLFGIVSTFQGFQSHYGSFIATRLLLGITESGFIPGGLWTLSTWYTRTETAKRVMFFYFGNQFGQASSKLLAYGILHMRGVGGKAGWFWLFVLMGSFTVLSGFVMGCFLPDSFARPSSAFLPNRKIFTERELYILRTRVLIDEPAKGHKKKHIDLSAFRRAVRALPPQYPASLIADLSLSVLELAIMDPPFNQFLQQRTSTWIRYLLPNHRQFIRFRTSHIQRPRISRFLPSNPSILYLQFRIRSFVSCPVNPLTPYLMPADSAFLFFLLYSNRGGETVILGLSCHMLGYIFNRIFTEISKRGLRYFGVVWTQTFGTFSHPLNIAWMSLACRDSEERALAMAMYVFVHLPAISSNDKLMFWM
jgi:hypothetical protein